MKKKNLGRLAAFALFFLFLGTCGTRAYGQEAKDLKVFVAPYGWLINLSGDIEARGFKARVNQKFLDLSEDLNYAGMLAIDILVQDRYGFTGNVNFARLGPGGSVGSVSLDSSTSMLLADMSLFYRLGSTPLVEDGSRYVLWDILAGARLWELSADLDIKYGPYSFEVSQSETWVDPIIGARVWVNIADDWSLEFRGDVGGFGVSSDLTWSASSILAYSFKGNGSFLLGYRGLGVDYQKGSGPGTFHVDAILHGPIIGLLWKF